MKYYGMVYEGIVGNYSIEKGPAFSSAYDALAFASQEWDNCNEPHGIRLLVVFRENSTDNQFKEYCNAFFDFDSDKSCDSFIERKTEIIWSDKEQAVWNGDKRHMG